MLQRPALTTQASKKLSSVVWQVARCMDEPVQRCVGSPTSCAAVTQQASSRCVFRQSHFSKSRMILLVWCFWSCGSGKREWRSLRITRPRCSVSTQGRGFVCLEVMEGRFTVRDLSARRLSVRALRCYTDLWQNGALEISALPLLPQPGLWSLPLVMQLSVISKGDGARRRPCALCLQECCFSTFPVEQRRVTEATV